MRRIDKYTAWMPIQRFSIFIIVFSAHVILVFRIVIG